MSDIGSYVKMAVEMGYSKADAVAWGTSLYKDMISREERAVDMQLKQKQLDMETSERNEARRERERAHALDLDDRDKERRKDALEMEKSRVEERERERIFELEKLKIEKDIAEVSGSTGGNHRASSTATTTINSSMPVFRDGEDISSYIIRFERICQRSSLSKDMWAQHLGCLLSGKALKIYCSVPAATADNYDLLKEALLRGFSRTADALRNEFRQHRITNNETYFQFYDSLSRILDLWLSASEIDKSDPDNLYNFMLCDQFMASLHPELRTYLKARKFNNISELVEAADLW